MRESYDAFLLVSFGGPEGPDDVMPFLRNVVRGRGVPDQRLREVAKHYEMFSGVSPINGQNRELLAAVEAELRGAGHELPLYWGNRNWHPLLEDTLGEMAEAGVHRAVAFATAAYSSYSSCRQYLEDIERAREAVGASAPRVDKIRPFFNHPGFVEANRSRLDEALERLPAAKRASTPVLFCAHSIPMSMAETSDYASQLAETARLVSEGRENPARLVFQSRSGPPAQPWLEPDVLDVLRELKDDGATHVALAPIGFVSDHMEVVYDLDVEARAVGRELGLEIVRAGTAGTHPGFVRMILELFEERLEDGPLAATGNLPPRPSTCPPECCPRPARPSPR